MRISVVTAASEYPVTLAEAKAHLRVDDTNEDDLILALIGAATDWAEQYCRRSFMAQTLRLTMDQFPSDEICIPRNPVQSVSSVKYVDQTGTQQTLSTSLYDIDLTEPARIAPVWGTTWPIARNQLGAVTVDFVAGYEAGSPGRDDVPVGIKAAIKLAITDLYEHRSAHMIDQLYCNPAVVGLLSRFRLVKL